MTRGHNRRGDFRQALQLLGLALAIASTNVQADDTEIYQTNYDSSTVGRPKVLIVIDDSGSMGTVVPGQRPNYDPAATYASRYDSTRIYWSTDDSVPASTTSQYFLGSKNRCAESYSGLANQGFFQTRARRWIDATSVPGVCPAECPAAQPFPRGGWCYPNTSYRRADRVRPVPPSSCPPVVTPGRWDALNSSTPSPRHVECEVDVTNSNPANGSGTADGYAKNNVGDALALSATTPGASDVNWGTESYTFYSAHYLDYLADTSLIVDRTRMEIAQDVITNLIAANTGIDFGLLEFNGNWSNAPNTNGGRVVHRIVKDMTAAQRTNVVDLVNTMTADGSTPLCEATYEAYRYLSGSTLVYGTQDDGNHDPDGDLVPRDLLAESPAGTYASPASDCAYTYVVIMTDGLPQNDVDANSRIESLTGRTCQNYPQDRTNPPTAKNCLPEITRWMANTDLDNDTTNGNQYGITYTIGFTTDQTLLRDAATAGKGEYFTANDADELTAAFQGAILSILSTDSTFTSPAVAVDTFSRTQSRDDVFYAMFKPLDRIDWPGNIKKLKIDVEDGAAVLVDANGNPALDPETGFIKDSATTFWGTSADGPDVQAGGVGALLAARDPATREIYSNTGSEAALQEFNSTNLNASAFGFDDDAQLFGFFGVPSQVELNRVIAWARGADVYDEDADGTTNEPRPWVLADILHSQPLVVNYGALGVFTQEEPDLRLVVGTNAGFVHMFGNDDGQEDWAFFPKELAPILRQRAVNPVSTQHVYGVDNTPLLFSHDVGKDGTIDADDGDKAYVYLTLRRGGDAMYALDISDPNSPEFMWMLDSSTAGFKEMGQSWSRPVIARIPGYQDGSGYAKPVLIFAAGYDTGKDASDLGTPDAVGRGLFIVDAVTGALVWSVTPAADSATNMQETGLLHSAAAGVTTVDSNVDGITDRVYFGDTGGNVWRVDLPGITLPTATQEAFHIVKLAALNGGTDATDRRFLSEPDVVRTSDARGSYDAVAIGSGDRTNPNSTDVTDQFYVLRDEQLVPYAAQFDRATHCDADADTVDDVRCRLPLSVDDLYDATANIIQTGSASAKVTAKTELNAASGWLIDLVAPGEKSLSRSLTLDGKLYFTTFAPETESLNVCVPSPGTGRLYALELANAGALRVSGDTDDDGDGDGDGDDDSNYTRAVVLGSLIPETPSPHFGIDGEIRLLLPPGAGGDGNGDDDDDDDCGAGILCPGAKLPDPYGSYWYQEQY